MTLLPVEHFGVFFFTANISLRISADTERGRALSGGRYDVERRRPLEGQSTGKGTVSLVP